MNHKLLTIIPLITALAACSSSQQDDATTPDTPPTGVQISFGGNSGDWNDATTRAGDTGLESIYQSFRVWGHKTTDDDLATRQTVMEGYNAYYFCNEDNTQNGWEYVGIENNSLNSAQSVKYWDYSATSYRFYAYSPADAAVTTQNGNTFSFDFAYSADSKDKDIPYFSDLWFTSNANDEPPYGSTVALAFKPLIAKVRFMFSYPEKTTKITVNDISFQDTRYKDDPTAAAIPLKGSISATYPLTGKPAGSRPALAWTTASENATGPMVFTVPYEEEGDRIHILDDATLYGKWYYMPPLDIAGYEQAAYVVSAVIDGNRSTAIVPAEFMQWKAGYQYTYVFKITEAGSVLTFYKLQVEQWADAANTDNNGSGTAGW